AGAGSWDRPRAATTEPGRRKPGVAPPGQHGQAPVTKERGRRPPGGSGGRSPGPTRPSSRDEGTGAPATGGLRGVAPPGQYSCQVVTFPWEPPRRCWRPIGMIARVHLACVSPSRRRATQAFLLAAGACALAAGCSAGASSPATMGGARAAERAPVPNAPRPANGASGAAARTASGGAPAPSGPVGAGKAADLTAVPVHGSQSVIFTASLSLRTGNVQATVARA